MNRTVRSLILIAALAATAHADVVTSGPEAGLATPALDMAEAQVIAGLNKKGNYNGGT